MTPLEGCPSSRMVVNPYLAIFARQEDWNTGLGFSLGNGSNQRLSIRADHKLENYLSRVMRKPSGFPTRSYTNRAV